jgi:hypothetical protein
VRINCKDSIDRTNLFQAYYVRALLPTLMADPPDLMPVFVRMGHRLSIQYCGTPAVRSEVLLHGQRTAWGRLRDAGISFLRFYQNAFIDREKQQVLTLLRQRRSALDRPRWSWLHRWRPRLRDGWPASVLDAILIFVLTWFFILTRFARGKEGRIVGGFRCRNRGP